MESVEGESEEDDDESHGEEDDDDDYVSRENLIPRKNLRNLGNRSHGYPLYDYESSDEYSSEVSMRRVYIFTNTTLSHPFIAIHK